MLIVLDKDGELYLFASTRDAEGWLEAIDIENGEYDLCDHTGQRFIVVITSPVTAFRHGAFVLRADGIHDAQLLSSLVARAQRLGRSCDGIQTIEQMKARIELAKAQPAQ